MCPGVVVGLGHALKPSDIHLKIILFLTNKIIFQCGFDFEVSLVPMEIIKLLSCHPSNSRIP